MFSMPMHCRQLKLHFSNFHLGIGIDAQMQSANIANNTSSNIRANMQTQAGGKQTNMQTHH